MSNKIGFKPEGETSELPELPTDPVLQEAMLEELLKGLFKPPEWQEAYEQSLFWAAVFNTEHKVPQA